MRAKLGLVWVLLFVVATPGPAPAATPPASMSVVDFFHLLCDAKKLHLETPDRASLLSKKNGAVVDVPNGYLRTHGDGAQPTYTLALFRRPDQSPVVAVVDDGADPFFEDLTIFTLDDQGRPVDITKKAWPLKLPKDGVEGPITRYYLPRYGRTITVVVQPADLSPSFAHRASVAWVKDRFIVEPEE
ncbi:hypothetical protein [Prosthecobacter sp.]|jgi:hypothetical protein|uniref:hypothetical protein n=1 Tax=Prosthecobacter sp. TaxID=1965333 RepID=UPI0037844E82